MKYEYTYFGRDEKIRCAISIEIAIYIQMNWNENKLLHFFSSNIVCLGSSLKLKCWIYSVWYVIWGYKHGNCVQNTQFNMFYNLIENYN